MGKRCITADCRSETLATWTVAPIVVGAATAGLFIPFLDSIGSSPNAAISLGTKVTFVTVLIIGTWLLSIYVGCLRKHEDAVVCFIDSIGIPGLFATLIYASKTFGVT